MQFVISKLKKINNDYLVLLKKFKNKINDKRDLQIILHTLACFWTSNKQIVLFCIDSLRLNKDKVSIYTGACDLGFSLNEHGSFLLSNKFKIYDDPVLRYLITISNWEQQADLYLEKALFSIDENISILEEGYENLFILPLSFLYKNSSYDFVKAMEDNVFRFICDYKFQSIEEISQIEYQKLLTIINFKKLHYFSFSNVNLTEENFENEINSFMNKIVNKGTKSQQFCFAFSAIITSALNAIFLQINTGFDLLLRPDYLAKNVASLLIIFETNLPEIDKVLNGREKYNVLLGNYFYHQYSIKKCSFDKNYFLTIKEENYFFNHMRKYDDIIELSKLLTFVDEYIKNNINQ